MHFICIFAKGIDSTKNVTFKIENFVIPFSNIANILINVNAGAFDLI